MLIDHVPLADRWRAEAARLDVYAAALRRDGDPAYAEEVEAEATAYRAAADQLELGEMST